jgi:hypothetical protein
VKILKFLRTARLNKVNRLVLKDLDKYEQLILKNLDIVQTARNFENTFQSDAPLWNAIQYCSIADLDLSILIHQLMVAETDWRRKLYARMLAMTLFECVSDIPAIMAKDFRSGITSRANKNDVWEGVESVRKDLANFGKKHKIILEEIRHIAIAHRDQRADLQLVVIKNIRVTMIWELSMEFKRILEKFNGLMLLVFSDLKNKKAKAG